MAVTYVVRFSIPYQELVRWQMQFPRDTPDPNPVIVEATLAGFGRRG